MPAKQSDNSEAELFILNFLYPVEFLILPRFYY